MIDNKIINIGIFMPTYDDIEKCKLFVQGYILGNNEIIKEQRFHNFTLSESIIITDKACYKFKIANDNARGYRWHKVFLYGNINKDILDNVIYPKIIPCDFNDKSWRMDDNIYCIN